jgi:CheY-like chemotaxis protein
MFEARDTRVLIIDDESDHAELIGKVLERHGYAVEVARGANDGLARAFSRPPDLVLLDLCMPKVDGLSAAACLRANPRTARVPIVFLSACGDDVQSGNWPARSTYLSKPFRVHALLGIVERALDDGCDELLEVRREVTAS